MGLSNKEKKDVYYRLAKKHGYRARSVYKLMHIDDEYNVFEDATNVVDLCAAPGSWSQYVAEKFAEREKTSRIVAIDVQDMVPISGVTCVKDDITSGSCIERILQLFDGPKVDVIVCDGAPDVTGIHEIDEYLQIELLLSALSISLKIGKIGSSFIGKCLKNEYTSYVLEHFKKFYENIVLLKPKASRCASIECFIYSTGMKSTDMNPSELDTALEWKDVLLTPCGYGKDPDIAYDAFEDINSFITDDSNDRTG